MSRGHGVCYYCRYSKRPKRVKWAPFCSQRCAANYAIENTMDARWCPIDECWIDGECPDHPGQTFHAGINGAGA
jgi:hypothetical protein